MWEEEKKKTILIFFQINNNISLEVKQNGQSFTDVLHTRTHAQGRTGAKMWPWTFWHRAAHHTWSATPWTHQLIMHRAIFNTTY